VFRVVASSIAVDMSSCTASDSFVRSLKFGQSVPYVADDSFIALCMSKNLFERIGLSPYRTLGHIELSRYGLIADLVHRQCRLKIRIVGKENFQASKKSRTALNVSVWAKDADIPNFLTSEQSGFLRNF
jgi:hypothetical protein